MRHKHNRTSGCALGTSSSLPVALSTWRSQTQGRTYVYIKANAMSYTFEGEAVERFLGEYSGSTSITGTPLTRSWTLLAAPAVGATTIEVMPDVIVMGWIIGDRIVLSPAVGGSRGTSDA